MMKKSKLTIKLRAFALLMVTGLFLSGQAFAQLPDDNEYVYTTMDLQGVLDLTMTTDPNLSFVFTSIPQYTNGIIKPNATKLLVESTVKWDLYVNAETANWEVLQTYSNQGTSVIRDTILEVRVIDGAGISALSSFTDLTLARLDIVGTVAASDGIAAGSYLTSPNTHQFRVDYRVVPTVTAGYKAGYYGLNVIYNLAEDL